MFSAKLVLPSNSGNSFVLNAEKSDDSGQIEFDNGWSTNNFTKLIQPLTLDDVNYCATAQFVSVKLTLQLTQVDCYTESSVICRVMETVAPDCTATFQTQAPLDMLLDPALKASQSIGTTQLKNSFKEMFKRLDQTLGFKAMFSNLWYASLPCFDTKGMTASKDGEKSVLRYCEWKGTAIPCSAMFTKFPTDQGMCCSFNIRAAEDIFQGAVYPQLVSKLQTIDKNASFGDSKLPKKYVDNGEPTTLPGKNKGLVLMLDAHTDTFASGSVDSDYKGFTGLIAPSGTFPFTIQESFVILPGHNNIIALSGSRVDADDSLRNLKVEDRKCMFEDENSNMTVHKNYTYSNCMFECALLYAKKNLTINRNITCTPWYFPTADSTITVCDPWEAVDYFKLMINELPDNTCAHCYPDCSTTIYETAITTVPFRRCDSSNVGVSKLCDVSNLKLPLPTKFGSQVKADGGNKAYTKKMVSSERKYASVLPAGDIFASNPTTYDAYDEDIAMVQIYFKKSTLFQMGSQPRMTWIDYLSTVGGLMGLVLGMGIVSIIELVWVCLRMTFFKMDLTHIIA